MWRFKHWDICERSLHVSCSCLKDISKTIAKKNNYEYKFLFTQFGKSVTSLWANIAEANVAISHRECRRILWIALREWNEAVYRIHVIETWLWIETFTAYRDEINQICKIVNKIMMNIKV